MAVRQHGMVQLTRRQDSALDEAKVEVDVGVTRLGDETRMPFGVDARLVHPRVQGGDIDVMDLLTGGDMMVQFDGIGTTSTEGITWVERVDELKVIHKRLDVGEVSLRRFHSHSHISTTWYPCPRSRLIFCWVASYTSCIVRSQRRRCFS